MNNATRITRSLSSTIPGIADSTRVTAGDLLFISGQTAVDATGVVPEDFSEEIDAAFAGLHRALTEGGGTKSDLVRITIYVTDLPSRSLETIRTVRDRWIEVTEPPASALIGVAHLFDERVHVEIDAVAAV